MGCMTYVPSLVCHSLRCRRSKGSTGQITRGWRIGIDDYITYHSTPFGRSLLLHYKRMELHKQADEVTAKFVKDMSIIV